MIKKLSLTLCLLTGGIWTGSYIPAAIAQSTPATVTQQQASSKPTLSLQDLPPGFRELPPEVTAQIQAKFDILSTQLARAGIKPEKYFAFINPDTAQLVVGFTGMLPNQPEQANFDAVIKQFQEPEFQQQVMSQIRESLKPSEGIEIRELAALPTVNNSVAEASTGMTVGILMQGQPLRMDLAAFRRSNVGAFTAIMYRNGEKPTVQLGDVARKLDNRIVQAYPGVIPSGTVDSGVTPPSSLDSEKNPPGAIDSGVRSPDTVDPQMNRPGTVDSGVRSPGTTEVK